MAASPDLLPTPQWGNRHYILHGPAVVADEWTPPRRDPRSTSHSCLTPLGIHLGNWHKARSRGTHTHSDRFLLSDMSGSSLRLETLPFELLCRISMFLLPEHATKLRETCTQMRRLRISLLNPTLKVLPWAHRWTGHVISGDEPRVAFRLPLVRTKNTTS